MLLLQKAVKHFEEVIGPQKLYLKNLVRRDLEDYGERTGLTDLIDCATQKRRAEHEVDGMKEDFNLFILTALSSLKLKTMKLILKHARFDL